MDKRLTQNNRSWIEKQLAKINSLLESKNSLPFEIILQAIGQTWQVHYIHTNISKVELIMRPNQELVLIGDIKNKIACKKLLIAWIKHQAKKHLTPWLTRLSLKTNLIFKNILIRGQNSRWGSCSANKTISLNYKLLFLPTHLTNHILIHELCHLKHLNHSQSFWRLLSTFDSAWKENKRELCQAEHKVPQWI